MPLLPVSSSTRRSWPRSYIISGRIPTSPGTPEYLLIQFLKLFVASARLYIVECSYQVARSNIVGIVSGLRGDVADILDIEIPFRAARCHRGSAQGCDAGLQAHDPHCQP